MADLVVAVLQSYIRSPPCQLKVDGNFGKLCTAPSIMTIRTKRLRQKLINHIYWMHPIREKKFLIMDDLRTTYNTLLSRQDVSTLADGEALEHVGRLIDLSLDLHEPEGLQRAITLSKDLETRTLEPEQAATLFYFLSNAWENMRTLQHQDGKLRWDWEQEEFVHAIQYLRRCRRHTGFELMPVFRRCQALTNLGNLLSNIGRFVEAIAYWNEALRMDPAFGMARGNRGFGLVHYGKHLYDDGHQAVLFREAHADLSSAAASSLEPGASEIFADYRRRIESTARSAEGINLDGFPLGDNDAETHYRKWSLSNRLFLNPLNDIGSYPIAARDVLTAPNIVMPVGEGPYFHGFFNQIKQEFVTARYLFYEGTHSCSPHFSDHGVLLYNTLDYPSYSLAVEKVKAAFRIGYSVFDKIAYFLNAYLDLGIAKTNVYLRSLWYSQQSRKAGVRSDFQQRPNWPLRGLFWLARDIYEDRSDFKDCLEPEAQELYEIRNHLEHKYLKLHDDIWSGPSQPDAIPRVFHDSLALSLYRKDFEAKTLRLLRLVRAALIYLSLAIHQEEKLRTRQTSPDSIIPGMPLTPWEDEWKT